MITFPQLKAAAAAIAEKYNISGDDSRRIIGQYNKDNNPALSDVVAGDLSSVPAVAASLGISCGKNFHRSRKNLSDNAGLKDISAASDTALKDHKREPAAIDTAPVIDNAPCDSTPANDHAVLETVAGEIVPNESGLTDGITDMIYSAVDAFCRKHHFEDMSKCRQTAWGACCMYIGQSIFKSNRKMLAGPTPKNGGFCYDFKKISQLCDIWVYMCGAFGKAPFISDFANFAGIDKTALYGVGGHYDGENITPARVQLLQKLREAQEMGLSGLIVDGRQNPTGALAALNHWHGWTQTREIIHTAGQGSQAAAALPVFGPAGEMLPEKTAGD